MPVDPRVEPMASELASRARQESELDKFYSGDTYLPQVIVQAKITQAYRMLMGMSTGAWGGLVVDSVKDRLGIVGLESEDKRASDALWQWWQKRQMPSESKLAHVASLISGRCFGLVWPDESGEPKMSLDNSGQMIVRYEPGSRIDREAALRYWEDEKYCYVNLYTENEIQKYRSPEDIRGPEGVKWEPYQPETDEEWPVSNPFGVVPVVELPVNRLLKPGPWGFARGEFAHVTGLIDRINLLTFLGLIVAFWQGFPIRGVIGDKIVRRVLTDDEGNEIVQTVPPFDIGADQVVQFENPETRFAQFDAADRSNLSIYAELDQLATLTKTPVTYFPHAGGISNISADTIRSLEGGLIGKIPDHQESLGGGWLELLRIAGLMLPEPVELPALATLRWKDHESRSLAERADAATKLAPLIGNLEAAEMCLNLPAEQLAKIEATGAMQEVMRAVSQPAPAPTPGAPELAVNGSRPAALPAPD